MVEYDLTMLSDPRLFGLIAAHGMVDFSVPPSLLAIYVLAAVPLGSIPTTGSFCGLSLLHFGRDMGMLGERRGMLLSVVMHSLVGLVYLRDKDVAFSLMMLYSLVWHIPGERKTLTLAAPCTRKGPNPACVRGSAICQLVDRQELPSPCASARHLGCRRRGRRNGGCTECGPILPNRPAPFFARDAAHRHMPHHRPRARQPTDDLAQRNRGGAGGGPIGSDPRDGGVRRHTLCALALAAEDAP